jgi:hypothetical protein
MARKSHIAIALAMAMMSLACAPTHTVRLQHDPQSGLLENGGSQKPLPIVGYTTHDGVHREFNGTVTFGDSLCTFASHSNLLNPFALPVDQVESVDVIGTAKNGQAVVLLMVVSAVLVALFLMPFGWGGGGSGW